MSYPPPLNPQQPPPYVPGPPTQPYGPPQQYSPGPQFGAPPGYPPQFAPPQRKRSKTPWIIIGSVVGLVLVVCLIGSIAGAGDSGDKVSADAPAAGKAKSTKKAAKSKPKTYDLAVGSTMTISGGGDTVKGTLRSTKTYQKGCTSYAPDPDNGMLVVVDVVVQQTEGSGSVNPLDFTFVADDGTSANGLSAAFTGCDDPQLESTTSLRAGQKRAGKIAFDTDSGSGTLEWAPGGLGAETVGSWKVG